MTRKEKASIKDRAMAGCMDMVRNELIEAGIIDNSIAPMFVANAVCAHASKVRSEALEEAAALIEAGQETNVIVGQNGEQNTRTVTPRRANNLAGIAFADAIRALKSKPPTIAARLAQLVLDAEREGLVLTIALEPRLPLAMGSYSMVPVIRPSRVTYKAADAKIDASIKLVEQLRDRRLERRQAQAPVDVDRRSGADRREPQ